MIDMMVTLYVECDNNDYRSHRKNQSAFGNSIQIAISRLKRQGWWVDCETGKALCPECNNEGESDVSFHV